MWSWLCERAYRPPDPEKSLNVEKKERKKERKRERKKERKKVK